MCLTMKSVTIVLSLALAGHVYAFPAYGVPKISERTIDTHPWIPVPVGGGVYIRWMLHADNTLIDSPQYAHHAPGTIL